MSDFWLGVLCGAIGMGLLVSVVSVLAFWIWAAKSWSDF